MGGRNIDATLYISNLDERVEERVLYDIMVQAGPLVEVYIPRDKGTNRHRGYGFAEYETEESANYALRLFSGVVSLHNKSLNFAFSGGGKKATPEQQPEPPRHNYSSRVAMLAQRTNTEYLQEGLLPSPMLAQTPPAIAQTPPVMSKFERLLSASRYSG